MQTYVDDVMNALTVFEFEGYQVRSLMIDNEPWWVGKDVCECLEIKQPRRSLAGLSDDERGGHTVTSLGGPQNMTCINEPGLYRLIFSSRKPAAERFKRWLAHEVLPALRKTGQYLMPKATSYQPRSKEASQVTTDDRLLVSAWTNCMKEVRLAFGPQSARDFYSLSPLPQVTGHVSQGVELIAASGQACLHHMLNAPFNRRGDQTLGQMMRLSFHVPAMNQPLRDGGVVINPDGHEGFAAFCLAHPRMTAVFAQTEWAHDWRTPLMTISGVTVGEVSFLKTKSTRCVLIPLFIVRGNDYE